MAAIKRTKKRVKKSGIIYFAVNNRIPNMVKIGMTIDSAESRLRTANRKHEFMCGTWTITQKVKTNDTKRTEELGHQIFEQYHDKESVSSEMYFIPEGKNVKFMADNVRKKDKLLMERLIKQEKAQTELENVKAKIEKLEQETHEMISLD